MCQSDSKEAKIKEIMFSKTAISPIKRPENLLGNFGKTAVDRSTQVDVSPIISVSFDGRALLGTYVCLIIALCPTS